jgi:hypothetical protein
MQRAAIFNAFYAALATATIATGQVVQKLPVNLASRVDWFDHKLPELRRLSPEATICVNPPLTLPGIEAEMSNAGEELAKRIRAAGFASGVLGTLGACDAVLFTEITGHGRKTAELDFRIVLSDEQIPRLCSSARGKSGKQASWRAAVLDAFADEARQIRTAQQKGMAVYAGALPPGAN